LQLQTKQMEILETVRKQFENIQKFRKFDKLKRVVQKDGTTSVLYKNISKKRRRYFYDFYTTLLDSSWSYCVLMFASSFYGSWLFFAILYYAISYIHGDLDQENNQNSEWIPCINQIDGFGSCFLFSLETQHTIGYGSRQTTTHCTEAMIVVSLQAVLGCIIQAFVVGLVFSKLSRPRNRSKTIIFSHNAIITMRNKKLCLVIRIGDLREDNFILDTQISLKLLKRRISFEGEVTHEMQALKISPDKSDESCIFFVWPLEIVHVIDEDSPFYDVTATELPKHKFELVAVLEGTNETSNAKFQARTSYLPHEILWGHRFESMMLYRRDQGRFQVNFSAFHSTFEVATPTISAKQLEKIMKPYVPPESRRLFEEVHEKTYDKHLANGTHLSRCYSLPSTLSRRRLIKKHQMSNIIGDLEEDEVERESNFSQRKQLKKQQTYNTLGDFLENDSKTKMQSAVKSHHQYNFASYHQAQEDDSLLDRQNCNIELKPR